MRLLFKGMRYLKEKWLLLLSSLAARLQEYQFDIEIARPYLAKGIPRIETFRGGKVRIGKNFRFNSGAHFNAIGRNQQLTFQVWGNLVIGENVRMSGTTIICHREVLIGDNVMIGGNVVIYDTDFHSLDSAKRSQYPEDKSDVGIRPVRIENSAFIGGHSTILKGSVIGQGAIVGAGSVVSGNIPPYEIWAGNPAKFVRSVEKLNINNS